MNKRHLFTLSIVLAAVVQPAASRAGDNTIVLQRPDRNVQMRLTPPQLPGVPTRQTAAPLDAAAVQASVDQRMRVLFDRAADPTTKLVTAESARKAGVGILSDQFADIDKDGDGTLEYSEVSSFFDAKSPIAKPVSSEAGKPVSNEIQIIK